MIDDSVRQRLASAANFAIYYGFGQEELLASFDLVILEPAAYSEGDIQRIRSRGTLVCGYLSVLEINHSFDFCHVEPRDYLVIEGRRKTNPAYSNWIMDPRSEHWTRVVIEMAERCVMAKGCDGVFLDTIGDVEDPLLPRSLAAQLVPAAALLTKKIRERFPHALLIQNSGIDTLYRFTTPYLDGILWENFPLKWPTDYWSLNKLNEFEKISSKTGLRVLLLAKVREPIPHDISWEVLKELQTLALKRGFLFYAAPGDYTRGVILLRGE
ncbi:MAG: hypothetical protein HPY71_03320 [Firmicutes bacterium]|nr:hypothetical protein [Bacillota bacterium]